MKVARPTGPSTRLRLRAEPVEVTGLFVTGTDTGVGKTLITAGIATALRARGIDVGVMKPIETGCPSRRGRLVPLDAVTLREASGSHDSLDLINPYRFREPLAPMVAAEHSGQPIDVGQVRKQFDMLVRRHRVVLVEGAGGLLVPITEELSFLGLVTLLRLPILVVIGSRLGVLNHARLTVAAALHAHLPVVGAILNHPHADRSPARRTNLSALRRLLPVPIAADIPHLSAVRRQPRWRDPRLQRLLARSLPQLLPDLCDWSGVP